MRFVLMATSILAMVCIGSGMFTAIPLEALRYK